jgi:hypothetical protein
MKRRQLLALTAATLLVTGCADKNNPTVPTAAAFAIAVSGEVLETSFDATTGDWICLVEVVATASGADGETTATWTESQYEFVNVGSGESWVDTWDVQEMIDRFGAGQIQAGESQTTVRRFFSPQHFDVNVELGWTLPGRPDRYVARGQFDCY